MPIKGLELPEPYQTRVNGLPPQAIPAETMDSLQQCVTISATAPGCLNSSLTGGRLSFHFRQVGFGSLEGKYRAVLAVTVLCAD